MEKAIEIKRRAQRFIQSGDLDGALNEYEKLVALEDCDPYNFVLLADLLFKRGDMQGAVERYLTAAMLYEKSGLYKNAIAVCKKMMRLSLSPAQVLERLAHLHALDGLGTEASLYYQQFAEHLAREERPAEAAEALRKAFEATPEEVRLLERLAEVYILADAPDSAAMALAEAAYHYHKSGLPELAAGCRDRAEQMKPGVNREYETQRLLASGAAQAAKPAEEPAPGAEDDENDENGSHGPPLLPSLREDRSGEPETGGVVREAEDPDGDRIERFPTASGQAAGLRFDAPALEREPENEPRAMSRLLTAAEIEDLLERAQETMRSGGHEAAARILIEAARAYDAVGRLENAATIYRSVARSGSAPPEVLGLWLANAERRDERHEAAEVACELGDRALQEGDTAAAREWFERALGFDENNALGQRRLQRLDQMARPAAEPPRQVAVEARPPQTVAEPAAGGEAPRPNGPPPSAPSVTPQEAEPAASVVPPADRVELALGRSEAVTFDLGSVLAEFQRGIEVQLSGDAQGHYDLAMAYREMGLLDHAVESFRMALGNPALAARATEMLGRCLLEQGRFDEAAQDLGAALERPGLDSDAMVSLRYLLGLALEAAGRPREALAEFEQVFAIQANFQDTAQKLRDLRRSLEQA